MDIPILPPNPVGIPIYDKDKLAWEMEADTNGDTLKFRLVHKDAKNIPRNHIRYAFKRVKRNGVQTAKVNLIIGEMFCQNVLLKVA